MTKPINTKNTYNISFIIFNQEELLEKPFTEIKEIILGTPNTTFLPFNQMWRREWVFNKTQKYYINIIIRLSITNHPEESHCSVDIQSKQKTKLPYREWVKINHYVNFVEKSIQSLDPVNIINLIKKGENPNVKFEYDPSKEYSYIESDTIKNIIDNFDKINPEELQSLLTKSLLKELEAAHSELTKLLKSDSTTENQLHTSFKKYQSSYSLILPIPYDAEIILHEENISLPNETQNNRVDSVAITDEEIPIYIELKNHTMSLISQKSFRNNIYGPTKDLANATQQINYYTTKFITQTNKIYDTFIKSILIAGKKFSFSKDQRKNFENYRSNQKNLIIFTWDEILSKFEKILSYLNSRK